MSRTTMGKIAAVLGLALVALGAQWDNDPNTVADWSGVMQGAGVVLVALMPSLAAKKK